MKITEIKNKEGEVLKTKENVVLQNFTFEAGDEFIPKFNKIIVKTNQANVNGKLRTINSYKLLCFVKDKDGNKIKNNVDEEEIFVSLTPAQYNTMNKKLIEKVEINQKLFNAYNYELEDKETKEKSTYIGVGFKSDFKKAKSFEDFDVEELDEEE